MDGFASAKIVFGISLAIGGVIVRISVLYWILLVIIASWVLHRTKIGNWIYAAGGDEESARSVGVPVVRTKIGLFMTVGFCAWVLGMHNLFAFNVVQSGEGVGNEFMYNIAAVMGGWLLAGGERTEDGGAPCAAPHGQGGRTAG